MKRKLLHQIEVSRWLKLTDSPPNVLMVWKWKQLPLLRPLSFVFRLVHSQHVICTVKLWQGFPWSIQDQSGIWRYVMSTILNTTYSNGLSVDPAAKGRRGQMHQDTRQQNQPYITYCLNSLLFTTQDWVIKSQISPAASPDIWHHTVGRTWLFIAHPDERWLIMLPTLTISLTHFSLKGWENVLLFNLPVKGLKMSTEFPSASHDNVHLLKSALSDYSGTTRRLSASSMQKELLSPERAGSLYLHSSPKIRHGRNRTSGNTTVGPEEP